MRKASKVFCIIGLATNTLFNTYYLVNSFQLGVRGIAFIITFALLLFFGIFDAIWGITTKKRSVLLGVLLIIFVNPLAGIFHLCSKDSEYAYTSTEA